MDLFEVILALLEPLLDALAEYAMTGLGDLVSRVLQGVSSSQYSDDPILAGFGCFVLGVLVGLFSLILFPHPLVHPSGRPGISLLISPASSGTFVSLTDKLARWSFSSTQLQIFSYGFTFAFGLALMRLFVVK